jgi:hypothetical protein
LPANAPDEAGRIEIVLIAFSISLFCPARFEDRQEVWRWAEFRKRSRKYLVITLNVAYPSCSVGEPAINR